MLKYTEMQGAIFDVDDTLLCNYPDDSGVGLHERSRLAAAQVVGERYGITALKEFTLQQSTQAFLDAKVHSLHAAVWQMLYMAGEVTTDTIEPSHPLLNEIIDLKESLHETLLITHGREVPGALRFVKGLSSRQLAGGLAVASTACRRDIDTFFGAAGFAQHFPEDRIVSRERITLAKPNPV